MICPKCGKITNRSYNGLCQGCYKYFKDGGKIHPLPKAGTVEHDESGKVICHICGRSYNRLGSHVRESHGMTIEEYKAEFGLCRRTKTTEETYSQTMRENAYRNNMDQRLLEAGKSTRIQKGESNKRKNKKVRLQEIIDKRNRRRKEK
jgi:NMD protein affecting ribosome stability and mRNA decay|nr:MAG TPA: ROS/MUCR transcriptional regulator protein [Caudoviricetes sp.]